MYSLENKSYGLKLTLHTPLTNESSETLRNELRSLLIGKKSEERRVIVDMLAPKTAESLGRTLYAL